MTTHMPIQTVVTLSGGMDSTVCASLAVRQKGADRVAALHISYGQRTEAREQRAFTEICDRLGIRRRLIVRNQALSQIGGSALTDHAIDVPDAGPEIGTHVPITYVPFRNAHFLSVAVSWAEVLGAQDIFIGAVAQDSSGYPDCRPEYYAAFNRLIQAGTREGTIHIQTPLIALKKVEIVRLGVEVDAPFELTWSCYSREDQACGVCESCALRLRAFEAAGIPDPILYLAPPAL
ncbi:MAG: 7-cyano-7-deazaguanine synthase QueC [Candidatus Korobacteraceae bacterium]